MFIPFTNTPRVPSAAFTRLVLIWIVYYIPDHLDGKTWRRPYVSWVTLQLTVILQAFQQSRGLDEPYQSNLCYEERLRELKLQSLEKRRVSNDLVLTHKIMFHQIDLEASKLFKFSRRPGLRRSSFRLLQQTGRTSRRRNSFACRVVKYWNLLSLAVASVQDHLAFKRQLDNYIYP